MIRLYPTSQFATKAGVTVRTLRYYDREGLLRPSAVTEAGHRRYSDRDLIKLQQILALKFLGFSLEQIREAQQIGPLQVGDSLQIQKRMMVEKRKRIDAVIRAIEELQEVTARQKELDWESLIQVIKVIQMEEQKDWWKKYYTEEQIKKLEERSKTYSEEERKADERAWAELNNDLKEAVKRGEDPGGPVGQDIAKRQTDLINKFTQSDPGIYQSLSKMWHDQDMPYRGLYSKEEEAFMKRAIEIYQGKA